MKNIATVLLAASLFTAPHLYSNEESAVIVEETSVFNETPFETTITLKEVPPGHRAVLEMTAWNQGEKAAGYYHNLIVVWDNKVLDEILDRPEVIHFGNGRETPARVTGWTVAILTDPEAADAPSPYLPTDENFNLTRYRFPIHAAAPGPHTLRIINTKKAPTGDAKEAVLKVRHIQIVTAPQ